MAYGGRERICRSEEKVDYGGLRDPLTSKKVVRGRIVYILKEIVTKCIVKCHVAESIIFFCPFDLYYSHLIDQPRIVLIFSV